MSAIRTAENKSHDLGTANKRFKDLYIGGIEAEGAVSVGSLTVGGNPVAAVDNTALGDVANPSDSVAASQSATKNYVDAQVAAVIDAAPETLNTLNELAAALGDDDNIAATVTTNTASIAANAAAISSNDTDIATNASDIATNAAAISSNDTDIATNASDIATNASDIATNAAAISSNDTDIATNASGIATNAAAISSNDTDIATNASGIATNAAAIATNATNISNITGGNASNISTNTSNIATNTGNISTNTSNIATNTGNISTNAAAISSNDTDIATNASGIATNVTNIAANAAAISSNDTDIATNASGISTNAAAISTNANAIAAIDTSGQGTNATNIATNTGNISTNTSNISTNTSNISANTAAISSNDTDIATNASGVSTNAANIASNTAAISSNDTNISTNTGNISTNTSNISTNTSNISANAAAISSNDTDIATNAGNISTNTNNIAANATAISARILTSSLQDDDSFASPAADKIASSESIKAYVDAKVSGIVDSAPAALDTLNELAAALGDDANFSTTISNQIGAKASSSVTVSAGSGLTGGGDLTANRTLSVTGLTLTHFADSTIQDSSEGFADVDTALMTAAAVADKIESYSYMPISGGTFTSDVQVNGTFTIKGDLIQIDNGIGDPDSVSFHDSNIVIDADNSGDAVAHGAGITLEGGDGSDITFQWNSTENRMELKTGTDAFTDIKVGAITSTGGAIEAVSTSAKKLDHSVTFSVTGAVTTAANVVTDFNETNGSTVTLDTQIADSSVAPSKLSGAVPVSLGGTGATTIAAARTALGVDAAGTDNSTNVTLANTNYLSISGQEITGGTIPVSSGGTGATTAAGARTALGVDAAGTDNSTNVTLANTNYLSISGQEITGGTVPLSSGGTGATTAAAARTALGVDVAGTDNSTNVTLATVTDNYLSIYGQEVTAGTVPVSLGGTGATTASAARAALEVDVAGTDNSTDVTLANTNYLSISGQEITGGTVPVSSGGTGATTAAGARTALGVDAAGTDNSTNVTLATVTDNYLSISGQEVTASTVPVSLGGTGATTASAARAALEVDVAGTDNSTNVTLATVTDNYLSISGQEITANTVPVSLGGTGATTAAAARTALDVDVAGTDNSTNVTLANTNYLSISGQEITGGTVPLSSGGTGATTAAAARTALGVDAAGTDNSTNVTLATVSDNYLSISGQEITAGTVPVSLGGTGATTAAAARTALGVAAVSDFAQGTAWKTSEDSNGNTLVTMSNEIDGHSGSWKVIHRLETSSSEGNITSVSLVADFQVRPSSRITKLGSLPDTIWNIPSDGVLQLR